MTNRASTRWPQLSPGVVTFILVILVTACLALAKPVILPTAVAVLLAFVLNPFVVLLDRRHIPRVPAVFTVVLVAGAVVGTLGWLLTSQIVQFLNELPSYQDNVARRVSELKATSKNSIIAKVEGFIQTVASAAAAPVQEPSQEAGHRPPGEHPGQGRPNGQAPAQPVKVVNAETTQFGPWMTTADALLEFLAASGLIVVLVVYILINREDIRDRFLRLIGEGHMTLTTRALDDAARGLSGYLLAQLMVNASFGIVVGGGVWLVGLPYPLLWGVLATFLRYIPYLGPWLALLFPLLLSLAIMPGWTKPLIIVAIFVGFEIAANFAIEPLLYGHKMGVSPAPLLIAIAFWSWLWGGMGLVLAVPLTVCLVVLGKHVPQLKFFDILLGDEPPLSADIQFYQRLLARDQDEAFEIARQQLEEKSLVQLADEFFIPALVSARSDFQSEAISDNEVATILEMTREIAEECAAVVESRAQSADGNPLPSSPVNSKLVVLACPARDAVDETAVEIFKHLLDPSACYAEAVSTDRLVSEIVAMVDEQRPSSVCIASLPPGGLAHTRLLCKRLRTRFKDLKIVVGRWGLAGNIDKNRDQLTAAGADSFSTSVAETSIQLKQLALLSRPTDAQPSGALASAASAVARTG